jgi:hypothetical protein
MDMLYFECWGFVVFCAYTNCVLFGFQVSYRIDLEFCLERNNPENDPNISLFDQNAFSFDIPMTVTASPSELGGARNNIEECSGKVTTLLTQQLAHMCLESGVRSYPLSCTTEVNKK